MKKAFLLLCLLLPAAFSAFAQWPFKGGYLMYYQVEENGDTVFRDVIDPVWVFPKTAAGATREKTGARNTGSSIISTASIPMRSRDGR